MRRKETLRDALVLIDVINDFDFPGTEALLRYAVPASKCIAALKERATRARIPIIYANDNFGKWRSDFREQIQYCLQKKTAAGKLSNFSGQPKMTSLS